MPSSKIRLMLVGTAVLIVPLWPQQRTYRCGVCTLTIFADDGSSSSGAVVQASGSQQPNLGHVFIELANNDRQVYLGFYGDPQNPSRGQLRVDADLVQSGGWTVKQTYPLTEEGYNQAHQMIDTWGMHDQNITMDPSGNWKPWCNCADFAEAVATAAGIRLPGLPKIAGGINTPRLWAQYLKTHGGELNPQRICSLEGEWSGGGTGVVVIKKLAEGRYSYQRLPSGTPWNITGAAGRFSGERAASASVLQSEGAPSWVIAKVLGQAKQYLTLTQSGQSCSISVETVQDQVEAEFLDGHPTGRIRFDPRAGPKSNFTLGRVMTSRAPK